MSASWRIQTVRAAYTKIGNKLSQMQKADCICLFSSTVASAKRAGSSWRVSKGYRILRGNVLFAGTFLSLLVAGASQAATLKVELWDVIAGPSTCCAPNPTALAQKNARVAGTGSDTVLANLPNPFGANYLPQVNTIIGSEAASHIFDIDSDTLVSGFYVGGSTGLSNAGQTLNDFFGFDIDGAGSGIGNNSILGTILRITGYVDSVLSETYKVRADDGYSIAIGDASLVVNDGLQAPTTTNHSYNGSAGVNTFSLVWFDNQIVQTALKVEGLDFVTPVPLPAGLPLMAAGLGALAIAGRRKKSAKTAK